MTTEVIRFDRLQAGLFALGQTLIPGSTILVAPTEFPRELATATYARFRMIGEPRSAGLGGPSLYTVTFPMTVTVTIGATPTVGSYVRLFISGRQFRHLVAGGETPEDIRDALLANIGTTPMVSATFAAGAGTDEITIAALTVGDVYGLSVTGDVTLVVDTTTVAQLEDDEVISSIELQTYSTERYWRSGAARAMAQFTKSLRLQPAQKILETYGLGVQPGNPINLDALAGPRWASRSSVTLQVSQVALSAATAQRMVGISLSVDARGEPATIPIAVTVTEP